ncbi:DUF4240 domain-containing protein [Actinomadura kijaniata]|uniref:DUF4240 domain-containing protein n=1 Tax=Actinomadura kijaniata TaxID=46161 RepID=UPI003F1D2E9B
MNRDQFWAFIDDARAAADANDADSVATSAMKIMAGWSATQIAALEQPLWEVLTESYRGDLWGAAYLINGGASDDGFDYFRGWLVSQGRAVYDAALADPDSLAAVPAVREAAAAKDRLEDEAILSLAWHAYEYKTGEQLPPDNATCSYPDIDSHWDFDDAPETKRRLPGLWELFGG